MRKAEITVHLFQETRHIMPDRPAKNLHQYEFCVCCGGITSYQGCGQLCRCCYFEISTSMKGGLDICKQTDVIFADNDLEN